MTLSPAATTVLIRADILVQSTGLAPAEMRLWAECEYDDLPEKPEKEFGDRLLSMIVRRVG